MAGTRFTPGKPDAIMKPAFLRQADMMADAIDLERYFERVGYAGPCEPTLEVLNALTRAHAQSIPFENIDVLLGRPILIEPEALFRKLVLARRGGYCFEQNGLFLAMLARIGFQVRPLSARIRLGEPDRRIPVARTHLVVEAQIDGESWITDVGVGSTSLTRALRWIADDLQPTPHETRRLVHADGRWFHQVQRGENWVDVYEFTGETMAYIDRKVANWYTSTHPDSIFRRRLQVALAQTGGRRVALSGDELSFRAADGTAEKRTLSTRGELLDALRDHFGIDLPPDTPLTHDCCAI
jgi:N-hydroxyarylamine O-acetyltransferase